MAKRNNGMRNTGFHHLKSAGWSAANSTVRTADKAASGLFRWMTTDHSGMSGALLNMPSMGFFDTIRYIIMRLLVTVASLVFMGVMVFVLMGAIQFLLFGHL